MLSNSGFWRTSPRYWESSSSDLLYFTGSLETPAPLYLCRRRWRRLSQSLVLWSFLPSFLFPTLVSSLDISSSYVALILVLLSLRLKYLLLPFDFWFMRANRSRVSRHLLPVILASFHMVFSFTFLSSYFYFIRRFLRRSRGCNILIVLCDCTPLMWSCLTLEFASHMSFIRRRSKSSYFLVADVNLEKVCDCYIFLSLCIS